MQCWRARPRAAPTAGRSCTPCCGSKALDHFPPMHIQFAYTNVTISNSKMRCWRTQPPGSPTAACCHASCCGSDKDLKLKGPKLWKSFSWPTTGPDSRVPAAPKGTAIGRTSDLAVWRCSIVHPAGKEASLDIEANIERPRLLDCRRWRRRRRCSHVLRRAWRPSPWVFWGAARSMALLHNYPPCHGAAALPSACAASGLPRLPKSLPVPSAHRQPRASGLAPRDGGFPTTSRNSLTSCAF